ncbi:MAG: hypothetical protein WEA56_16870 [Balneolaceae bacterium]
MEVLNEFINNWYPLLWILSGGMALAVWAWASRTKARLDINHATKLIAERRYRNGQMSKEEYEKQVQSLSSDK